MARDRVIPCPSSGRGKESLVLAPSPRLARSPDGGADEDERCGGDCQREGDDCLPGEHFERAVERPVEP